MKLSDIRIGEQYAVSEETIQRACRDRAHEPGFLARYGLDDETVLSTEGRGLGSFDTLHTLLGRPDRALARWITDGHAGDLAAAVTVLSLGEPYRKRMDGVRVEADARGEPVELLLHYSALQCPWADWQKIMQRWRTNRAASG